MGTLADYRGRPHWSFSSLHTLQICSLQYFFDKIAKLPRQFISAQLCIGTVVHHAATWATLLRKEGKQPIKKEAVELVSDLWNREVRDTPNLRFDEDEKAETCAEQVRALVGCLIDSMDMSERVVAVNEAFACPVITSAGEVLELPLVGELDVVVEKDKRMIVDFKTSGRRWSRSQADTSLQATIYGYIYRALHGQNVQTRFDVLVKNKKPVLQQLVTGRTIDQYHRLAELIKAADRIVQAQCFWPQESMFCAGCGHLAACKVWHRESTRVSVRLAA